MAVNRYGTDRKMTAMSSKKNTKDKIKSRAIGGEIDYTFLVLVILMVAAGLVMLLSASAPAANVTYDGDSYYFFKKQLMFVAAGFVGMWLVSRIDMDSYKKLVPIFMWVCVILLVLVAIPGVGKSFNGSRRWLPIPGIQIQPSEFMKPVIAMYFALLIERGKYDLKTLKGNAPFCVWIFIIVVLMGFEPHLSGAIIIAGIGVTLMFVGGTPMKPIVLSALPVGAITVVIVKLFSPVRWNRIVSFLHPFADIQNTGYQVAQGLYAIGSGGLFGLGLGQSVQKYSYLPEPYNDFIYAIVCEELGFVGAIVVVALFALLIMRAVRIVMNAKDMYQTLVGTGIIAQIAIQTVLNIAVATSSVPNTGVALPFFSYGGTAILTLLLEMGILLNISRNSRNAE